MTKHEQRRAATRRRRLRRLGAAIVAAAAVVAVAAIVSSPNGSSRPTRTSTVTSQIPERDGVLGDPSAPVTITEYVDLQCPICAQASKTTLPTLVNDYVRTGKVKLQARTLHFLGADSTTAARFAAGAREQGKLWPFLETLYANQGTEKSGYVTDDFLRGVAEAAGVDASAAFAYARTTPAQTALETADAEANAVGADSTPTFTIRRGDGAETILAVGLTDLKPALDEALAS